MTVQVIVDSGTCDTYTLKVRGSLGTKGAKVNKWGTIHTYTQANLIAGEGTAINTLDLEDINFTYFATATSLARTIA